MPYYRKTITLPKELVLKHALAQIEMQPARDDGNYTSEKTVKELIKEELYYRTQLSSESTNRALENDLKNTESPE